MYQKNLITLEIVFNLCEKAFRRREEQNREEGEMTQTKLGGRNKGGK